jgi:flagellar biosynthesis/type III secretory pathway chaperone
VLESGEILLSKSKENNKKISAIIESKKILLAKLNFVPPGRAQATLPDL